MSDARQFAFDVVKTFRNAGYQALWAGGCVRDQILGLIPADYDVATNALPQQVRKLFPHTIAIGAHFGVVEILGPKGNGHEHLKVQVATFRSDGVYRNGRHPETVTFSTPQADAQRRDFTINGLFFDPIKNQLIDYVGGCDDLKAGILRAIGNPLDRFREDKLRLLRAVRMAARFGLSIEENTLLACRAMARQICEVSAERIAEELRKLLTQPSRNKGYGLLVQTGLTSELFRNIELEHNTVERLLSFLPPCAGFELSLVAVFHEATTSQVHAITQNLKLSNNERHRILWLHAHRTCFLVDQDLKKSVLYPILIQAEVYDLLTLQEAELKCRNRDSDVLSKYREILSIADSSTLDPPPLLTGDDLKAAGWQASPVFKIILTEVRNRQLDDEITTQAAALEFAERYR